MARGLLLRLCAIVVAALAADAQFLVGVGKADMTGPIVEVNQMGYVRPLRLSAAVLPAAAL